MVLKSEKNIAPLVLCTQINGHGGIPRYNRNLLEAIAQAGFFSQHLSLNDEEAFGSNRNKSLFIVKILIQLFKRRPTHIILAHLNFFPLVRLIRIFLGNATIIIPLHGVEAWKNVSNKKALSHVNQFWAVSSYTKRKFIKYNKVPEQKINIVYNTLPPNWTSSTVDTSFQKFFLTVTRLAQEEQYKHVDTTLMALHKIRDMVEKKGWKYAIVASGDDVERHKQLVKTLGLSHLVEFKHNLSDNELQELYQTCSCFVMPSTGEGFGIVFLEAMVCRKPCIGAISCGSEDVIVDNETGFLITPTPETIAEKLQYFIEHQEAVISFGEAGRKRYEANFTFDIFTARIKELLLSNA